MLLPTSIYENPVYPAVGDWFYVVPESDAVVAEVMEVTESRDYRFTCGGYEFNRTSSFGQVGAAMAANAYSSVAAYWAVKLIPNLGWNAHNRRKDVFTRIHTNARITPHIKRVAYLQIDHREGNLVLLGHFLGEGGNMLAELSETFAIVGDDPGAASKIRDYLNYADGIIRASYAMNVTKESALGRAAQIQSDSNFDRGVE